MPHSVSDTLTAPHDPMFIAHVSHYLPGFPALDLPSPHQALTNTFDQLSSPGSTPEPYAEQLGVTLAAEMGNPVAVNVITNYYSHTGVYGTSN
jgi:hypothetical protein